MKKLKAILVDDEESARDVLENLLIRFCPDIEISATFSNVTDAVAGIKKFKPNLVFLDIEMPNYAGYELVNFFDEISFEIVFTTAYDKYALKAFEVSATDYLLKPIDIERLKQAVAKVSKVVNVKDQAARVQVLSQSLRTREIKNLILFEKGSQHLLPVESIIAIEAQESYCHIHTTSRVFMASKNLRHFENALADNPAFIRVHKSWIIAKQHIQHYSRSEFSVTLSNNLTARISKYKKSEFEAALQR
ncbi:MAG: LytR/AlgR family response regulator transcription factor [Bacteroidota bacterium]